MKTTTPHNPVLSHALDLERHITDLANKIALIDDVFSQLNTEELSQQGTVGLRCLLNDLRSDSADYQKAVTRLVVEKRKEVAA